ncbi:hypothetical protein GcM3_115027 [Golovinomyces cichoracearum]|uniref:Secreted effector protein n=1 Tax=Golovinomyces cichoracearum TaxID=62708 RepID=A0A420I890_9PEZI|nr:hypothetical protein GcM3_115027 [Golovinomyces cichoracearum]
MQFLTYFITLCLLGPLASVAVKPYYESPQMVYIKSSYMCEEKFLFSQPTLRNEATEGCSKIKRTYECKGFNRCFGLRSKPIVGSSRAKIYRGPHFTISSEENAYESSLYEWNMKKDFLKYAEIYEFLVIMGFDPTSDKCTFKGVVMRSAETELECIEKPPKPHPSYYSSSSPRSPRI